MIPVLRVVPPSTAQLQANPDAPHVAFFADAPALVLATAALGLGVDVIDSSLVTHHSSLARVTASRGQLEQLAEELAARNHPVAGELRRYLVPQTAWRLRTRELPVDRPHVMGILNLTNDSFSGDGVGADLAPALRHAESLRAAGAAIIDVGAETARADRPSLDAGEEARTVAPVVAALVREGHLVSSDTYKPLVARAALECGAEIVNDISGLTLGTGAAEEAARHGAGYVLNYSYSVPKRRPDTPPVYHDVVAETVTWFESHLATLSQAGLPPACIAIDPGIAFGKSHDEDLQVLRRLGELQTFGQPVLLAHSRKNFLGSVMGRAPSDRDLETHVAAALAYEQGARIFRVHDVEGCRRALEIVAAISSAAPGAFAPAEGSWPWRAGASATHMTRGEADHDAPAGQRW